MRKHKINHEREGVCISDTKYLGPFEWGEGVGGGGGEASRFYRQKWAWPSTDISVAYHKQLHMREMK